MRRHRRKALLEKRDVLKPVHEAHMRDRMDETSRVDDRPLLHQIGPELSRQVELDVDVQCLGNIDRPVAALGGVVELAIRRMACAGVVPGIGTLLSGATQHLEHLDVERRLEFL